MNILLFNDDGITAANMSALKVRLIAAGNGGCKLSGKIDFTKSYGGAYVVSVTPASVVRLPKAA